MPTVSVVLPAYNVEKFIGFAIESVLRQTMNDWELIIVDDCSSDGTLSIVESYAKIEQRILVVKNDFNMGISRTLNRGLAYASGRFVSRLDGDDLISADKLERHVNFLSQNSEYDLIGSWIVNIDSGGDELGRWKYPVTHEQAMKVVSLCSPVLHVWTARRELYEKLRGYRDTNPAEDYDFLLRAIAHGCKIGNLPHYDTYVRLRSGNTLDIGSLKQRKAFNYLLDLYHKDKINDALELNLSGEGVLTAGYCEEKIHKFSVRCLKSGLSSKNRIKKTVFLMLSLVSRYTIQDVIRRRAFKRKMKKISLED
jgi:glycosyltransferase involved in cell wall biosynthesis